MITTSISELLQGAKRKGSLLVEYLKRGDKTKYESPEDWAIMVARISDLTRFLTEDEIYVKLGVEPGKGWNPNETVIVELDMTQEQIVAEAKRT
jgi:hypothetical protein